MGPRALQYEGPQKPRQAHEEGFAGQPHCGAGRRLFLKMALLYGAEPVLPPLGMRDSDFAGLQCQLLWLYLPAARRVLSVATAAH